MLQITAAQYEQLQAHQAERFFKRVMVFIAEKCNFSRPYDGRATLHGAELEQVVRELLARARTYHIEHELGLVQFVILGLGYERDFDAPPLVRAMLSRAGFTPDENIQVVLSAVLIAEARSHQYGR